MKASTKQRKRIRKKLSHYFEFEGELTKVVDRLDSIRGDYPQFDTFHIENEYEYHSTHTQDHYVLYGTRDETDKEYEARQKREEKAKARDKEERAKAKAKKEAAEKRELARLKKKYRE